MPELSEARLAAVLASVGEHLVLPETETSPAPADPRRNGSTPHAEDPQADGPHVEEPQGMGVEPKQRTRWTQRTRVLVAAAVVVAVVAATLAVAPARRAVADWFGLGSTGIERAGPGEGDPADLPHLVDGLDPVDRATAERELGGPLPTVDDPGLGAPDVLALAPEGGVVMAWSERATTLWVQRDGMPVDKVLSFEATAVELEGLGDGAVTIEGDHVLETPLRRLAAANVVIWLDGDFELRLESEADIDDLVALAHSTILR